VKGICPIRPIYKVCKTVARKKHIPESVMMTEACRIVQHQQIVVGVLLTFKQNLPPYF
jgi:hypothetical protein